MEGFIPIGDGDLGIGALLVSPAFGRASALLRPIGPSACARPLSCSTVTQPLGCGGAGGGVFGMLETKDMLIPWRKGILL
jgi:hypothetical protein